MICGNFMKKKKKPRLETAQAAQWTFTPTQQLLPCWNTSSAYNRKTINCLSATNNK